MSIPYLKPPTTSKPTPLSKPVPSFEPIQPPKTVTVVLEQARTQLIEGPPGPQGIPGPVGPAGPQGPAGSGTAFVHNQASASATWTINHNLGVKPSVELYTVGGSEFDGEVVHVSDNQCVVYLTASIAGYARCF